MHHASRDTLAAWAFFTVTAPAAVTTKMTVRDTDGGQCMVPGPVCTGYGHIQRGRDHENDNDGSGDR